VSWENIRHGYAVNRESYYWGQLSFFFPVEQGVSLAGLYTPKVRWVELMPTEILQLAAYWRNVFALELSVHQVKYWLSQSSRDNIRWICGNIIHDHGAMTYTYACFTSSGEYSSSFCVDINFLTSDFKISVFQKAIHYSRTIIESVILLLCSYYACGHIRKVLLLGLEACLSCLDIDMWCVYPMVWMWQ
jgi:hypothetical protein